MTFTKTLAALTLTTSLLASACALEEGDELDAEIGETDHALVNPDEDFSGDGYQEIPVAETSGAAAVVQGSTGTTYAVGDTWVNGRRLMAVRLMDRYGTNQYLVGRNLVPPNYVHAWGNAAVNVGGLVSDSVWVAGAAVDAEGTDIMLARFNASGLDTSYSNDGMGIYNLTGYDHEEAKAIVATSDGKIIVGANSCTSDPYYGLACRTFLVRLNASTGQRDTTWGNSGVFILGAAQFPNRSDEMHALAVDRYGGVIVVSEQRQSSHYAGDVVVRRVTPTGQADTSFAAGAGQRRFLSSTAGGVAIDPTTHRIVVSGGDYHGTAQYVWQLSYSGILIPGFGGSKNIADGWAKIDYTSRSEERPGAVKIDRLGRIILLGSAWEPSAASFTVVRLLQQGEPDTSFDNDDGKEFVTFPTSPDSFGLGLHLGYDDITVAGLGVSGSTEKFAIARIANP
jgi:uncharacterized delta-60 repeat protein